MTVDRPDLDDVAFLSGELQKMRTEWWRLWSQLKAKDAELDRLRSERDHYALAITVHRESINHSMATGDDLALWEALDFGRVA